MFGRHAYTIARQVAKGKPIERNCYRSLSNPRQDQTVVKGCDETRATGFRVSGSGGRIPGGGGIKPRLVVAAYQLTGLLGATGYTGGFRNMKRQKNGAAGR